MTPQPPDPATSQTSRATGTSMNGSGRPPPFLDHSTDSEDRPPAHPTQRLHRHNPRAFREDLSQALEQRQRRLAKDVWESYAVGALGCWAIRFPSWSSAPTVSTYRIQTTMADI